MCGEPLLHWLSEPLMRRGILSSLPDDDYLSVGLSHGTFNLYATICRATDRQGFLNIIDDSKSFFVQQNVDR
jgi:hypothetical protein